MGEEVNFSRFCADFLYGRPLTMLNDFSLSLSLYSPYATATLPPDIPIVCCHIQQLDYPMKTGFGQALESRYNGEN